MTDMDNNGFNYTYSAREQEEIKAIRKKYTAKEEKQDKMEQLRRLDASVTQRAQVVSLVFGVIGTLLLGTGMSVMMTELGAGLGTWATFIGIAVGIFGMALIGLAYPVYNRILRKQRERIAPEILRLTDELLK